MHPPQTEDATGSNVILILGVLEPGWRLLSRFVYIVPILLAGILMYFRMSILLDLAAHLGGFSHL